jgi:hypothetical protein
MCQSLKGGDSNMKKVGLIALLGGILLNVLSFSGAVSAGTFTTFAPKDYIRSTSKPVIVTDLFSVLNPDTSYTLHIYNGGKNNQFEGKVSSALISLNGVEVVRPNEFSQNVFHIQKPINLVTDNALEVELRSKPGSGLTIEVIGVDNDKPTILATLAPSPNAAGWNNTDVTVNFVCSDTTSGIASCPGPVGVTQEGANQSVTGAATDNAGNSASTTVTVNIDKTPPTIVASLTPSANALGWNTSDVTAAFACADQLSGIGSCPTPVLVTDEGANQQVWGEARDQAGNTAITLASVSLDKTPPDVMVTEPGGIVENSPVTIRGTASDALSGIANVTCAGNAAVWSAGDFSCPVAVQDGPNAILVEARDLAGNVGTSTATFVANLAELELRYVDDFDSVYIGVWIFGDPYYRPRVPAGYYSLGDSAPLPNVSSSFAMVAKELKAAALKRPDNYELLYRDQICGISGCTDATRVYRPIPPPGYVCLGVLVKDYYNDFGHMYPEPDDMRCVREDLTTAGTPGARLGIYSGGKTTWQFSPADSDGICTGQFAWSDSEAPPPSGTLRTIGAHAVRTPRLSTADVVDLIESFGPTISLHPQEDYFPDDPQYVLDRSLLRWGTVLNEWDYNLFSQSVLGEVATSASTLLADAAYAQSFNNPPDPSFRTWITIPDELMIGNLARARVLVRARTWNTLFTEIQFWMYYPFNGPGKFHANLGALWDDHEQMNTCGRHYSDWEHVSVLFESGMPVSMYLSRHDLNVWITRKDFGFLWDRGVHPVIYAGRDSHAHYTATGRIHYKKLVHTCYWYLGGTCLDVDLEDYTDAGATLQTFDPAQYWFASSTIPGVTPSDPEPDWLQFAGRWGQYERLSYTYIVPIAFGETYEYSQKEVGAGPSGPAMKGSWQNGDWCVFSGTCQ